MIGTSTLINVAAGSGLKILSYVAGRIIDGYFETLNKAQDRENQKVDNVVKLQGGSDNADDWTKHTRRVLAQMLGFTACFVIALFALQASEVIPILTDRDKGIFGWIVGGNNQTIVQVSKAQMIMNMWPLMELMFGFYFTKIGTRG